ncbi:palindromic element RPE4 domain-containing protein [Rickettsia endosymbiont of Ixodes pacificus]|nr:palindromic element RPE4 domain-containing protein [Rickettsia endosymbiont of Ixodes pacificus]
MERFLVSYHGLTTVSQKKIKKGLDPAIKSRDDSGGIDPRNNASWE